MLGVQYNENFNRQRGATKRKLSSGNITAKISQHVIS